MNKKAFTLIETMSYIALFSIIIVVVINMGVFLATESQRTIFRDQMITESTSLFTSMIREMRTGKTFLSGSSTLNTTFSTFAFEDTASNTITYSIDSTSNILSKQVNTDTPVELNVADLPITKFQVTQLNPASRVPLFEVTVQVSNVFNQTYELRNAINFIYD